MKKTIDTITVSTNNLCYLIDDTPMNETICFFRSSKDTGDRLFSNVYHIPAQRDSFWRAIRAMRRLAVRKWEKYSSRLIGDSSFWPRIINPHDKGEEAFVDPYLRAEAEEHSREEAC